MDVAPDNALIVYTDVGFIFVRDASELHQIIGDNDVLLMNIDDYQTKEKLLYWLPKKIAEELSIQSANQPKFIASGIIAVKNTPLARSFVQKWLEICSKRDYAFLKYDKDGIKGFTYDQSLLSIIADRHPKGVKIVPIEDLKKFTVYHHLYPGNNKPILILQVLPLKQIREWLGKYFPNLFMYIGF